MSKIALDTCRWERGYSETLFGRKTWFPRINSKNQAERQGSERAAINAPIQGTNVAAGKASVALTHDPGFQPGDATDADLATEWRSLGGLPTWIYVDLGTNYNVDRAVLRWTPGRSTLFRPDDRFEYAGPRVTRGDSRNMLE